jgi:ubiquinone/menaquinone biosynthesis C-methylase UbiE
MDDYKVKYWTSKSEIEDIAFSEYWNDENTEKDKDVLYILDDNFDKMEGYLKESGLIQHFHKCLDMAEKKLNLKIQGKGADLASGTLWTVPHLLKREMVKKIYCVEYSQHRLLKIGPKVLKHYNVPKNKVVLCLGSFYDIKLPDNSLDFIFLTQAFHHADDPKLLLGEIRRVLKPGGIVVITGEHLILNVLRLYVGHMKKYFISRIFPVKHKNRLLGQHHKVSSLIPKTSELIPPDPLVGDHYYLNKDYKKLFSNYDFKSYRVLSKASKLQGYILIASENK